MIIDKNVIIFSTADWQTLFLTNKQHMAKTFAGNGYKVLYVESLGLRTPLMTSGQDLKRIAKRLIRGLLPYKKVEQNVWVCAPIQIPNPSHIKIIQQVNALLLTVHLKLCLTLLSINSFMIWSYHAYCKPVLGFRGISAVIYHCVDDLSSVPGIDSKTYKISEDEFSKVCDVIFVTNQNLISLFPDHPNVQFLPNVVDVAHFRSGAIAQRPADMPSNQKPIVGFHGALSDFKLDFELLNDVARSCDDLDFIIIGIEREGQRNEVVKSISKLENVYMLGHKNYYDLPPYISRFDVALMPYLINPYTDGMFPMKYYEYVAAYIQVVTTRATYVQSLTAPPRVGETASDIEALIRSALNDGQLSTQQSDSMIGDNTWQKRFEKMMKIVSKVTNK